MTPYHQQLIEINQIVRDYTITSGWRVIFKGQLTTPLFNSEGAATAYLNLLIKGVRKPEYVIKAVK